MSQDDRRLLEKAAKAAGLNWRDWSVTRFAGETELREWPYLWNPLTDDGDALQLAVKLQFLVNVGSAHTEVRWVDEKLSESYGVEQWDNGMTPEEWTRRAIVRAAAAIGEQMP